MQLEIGMPVILVDNKGLEKFGLYNKQLGMANSVMVVEGIEYMYFMPDSQMKMYAMRSDRVVIDMDKIDAWRAEQEKEDDV